MSSIVISGDTSGTITLTANSVASNNTLTLPTSSGTLLTIFDIQNQSNISYTTGGSNTAYTLTPIPASASYVINQRFNVTIHDVPGDSPTINISGLGAKNLKYYNAQGNKVFIDTSSVITNWNSDIIYDGTDFVLVNPLNRALPSGTQKAIFGYGTTTGSVFTAVTNIISNNGIVAGDVTGVGTARNSLAAAGYGTDKAIFGYGSANGAQSGITAVTNLVSNSGVVATDTTGVGTARYGIAAAGYGTDKAIFGFGLTSAAQSMTNLVSNVGVVATDTTGVGTARYNLAATKYGYDKAIFGFGYIAAVTAITNLVSNVGVVATDTTGVGTARQVLAATNYGIDKAIFGYGLTASVQSITNLVSNTGVVATDTTGVGTARYAPAAAGYGTDKAAFAYGTINGTSSVSVKNLVSNAGIVAADTTGVGTTRFSLAAAGFSLT